MDLCYDLILLKKVIEKMEMDIFDSLNMIGSGDQDSLTGFVDSVQEFTSPKATEEDQIYNVIGIDKLFESATTDIDDSYDFSDIQDIKDFSVNPNYMQLQEEIHFPEDNGIQSSGSYQVEHSGSLTNSNRNNISQQISYSVCNSQVKQATPIQSAHSHFKDKSQIEIEIIDSVRSSKASSFTQKDFKAITGKNPKSGYLIFCSDIRKTIADKNPGVSFSDIGKAMGVEWNKLTEKQKQEYQERAKVINLQKLNESRGKTEEGENAFGSPSSPPDEPEIVCTTKYSSNSTHPFNSKQTLGPASAIAISSTSTVDCAKAPISGSKASSGFDFYCNEMRKKVSERHPKANYEDAEALLRLLKSEWNNLSEKDRLHFEQKVQQCRTFPNLAPIGASCKAINYRSGSRNGPGFRNFKALTGQNQKTGYLMFCSEVRKAITDKNPGVSFSDLGKAMGVEWNKLTEKQKHGYQERAKEINLQILKETQDRPKDEPPPVCNSITKSKPSKSGFSVFATEYRKEMKKRFPNYNRREISQLVSNEWKKLGADEKLRYVHQAAAVNLVVESEKVSSTVLPNESVKMDFNVSSQSLNSDHSNSTNLYPFSTPLCNSELKKGKKKSPTINETFSRKGRSNGYQLYCVERHKRVKEEMPDATFGEICRFVGNEWKGLPASIRKEYQEKANMINLETQAKKEQKPEIIALDRERNLSVNHQPVPVPTIQPSNVVKSVSWSNPANQIPPPEISICTSNQSVYRSIVPSPIVSSPQWIQKKPVMQTQLPIPNTQMIYFIPQKWNQVHTVKHVAMPPRLEPIVPNVSIIHQQPPTIITEVVLKEEVISKEKLMSYKIYNPLSAYQYFFVEMQRRVTGKYPAISFDKASQLIDTQWYHLNHEERKVLHDRVEQIKNEIEKAKLFYARDCETPDSVSQTGSEADSLGNPDSPAVIKNEPDSFLDEFGSLEDYFDQLQSPENMRDVQPSDTEMKFETPESINNSVPKDTSQLSRELNLSSCLETPKAIKNECDSVDVFDMIDTSINSSQHDLTEHFSNSDLPVSFENFKAAIEGRNGSILAASDQLYGNPQKKKKSSLPKSCPQFAYEIFFKEMEKNLRAKNPSATYDEISKLIDIQWNRLKKSDKKVLKTQARRSLKLAKEQGSLPVDPSSVVINCDKHTQETIKIESQNFKSTDSPHLQALLTSPVKTEIFDSKFDRVEGKMPLVKKLLSAEKFDATKTNLKCNPKSLNGKKTAISFPKCKKSAMRSPMDNKSEMKSKKFRRFEPAAENKSSVKLEFGPLRSPKHSNESVGNDSFLSTDYKFDFKPKADLLYETLMNFEEDGRKPITLFIQLPSKEKWPDYYKAVKHPMDMKTFDAKLNSGRYKNIKGVIRDLRLMFRNCLEYHKKGSQIYKDAIMLKQILNKAIRDCKPELELPNHIEDLEECEDASNYYNLRKIKSFFGLIKNLKEKNKALSRFFWKPMDTELNPKYYEIIKEPMDFDIITQRISDSSYVSLSDIYTDFKKLFQNTYQYYEPESQTYRAALSLHKFASQKFSELNQQVDRIPHISNSVQDLLLSIFASTFNHKNSNGKHLSDSVSRLPSFDWIDGVWTRVETLESIMMRLNKGLYFRLDELQNDLFSVFERARRYQDVYDEIYEDSVKLQRKYIAVRDQFCAHGIILKSQALNFKIKDFTAELQLHKREQTLDCDDDQMVSSCGDINSSFKNASGDPFCVGDYIYVNPLQSESISDCLIMEISKLWTSSMGEEMVYGTQYFKPQDINMWLGNIPEETSVDENIISREMVLDYLSLKFHDHELIKSEKCLSLSFSKVVGKCVILSPLKYCKLLIENFHPQDIYSCQYLYSFSSHKFENLESVPLNSLRFPNYITTSERVEPLQVGLRRSFFELKAERRAKEMVELFKYIEKARLSPVMRDIVKKEEMVEDETYYIQYRSPIGHLKIGDFVYIKSGETYRKFILHIHRILVATSGEETLIGNRYIIQDKILDDKSGALFSFKEAYYLVNRETHPLCNVVGRCLVLNFKDYLKTRPTQIAEEDVYLCEFSFDEECQCLRPQDFAITKYKLPSEVYQDEMYSWPKMISPKEFQRNHIIDGEHFDIVYPIGDGSFSRSNILDPTFQYKVPAPVQGSKPKFKFNNYYFFFQNERFKELRKEYPDKCPSEIYSLTAQEWKGLSEEVKMDYQRRMKERAALYEQQSCDTSVEEFDEQDGRKSYRLVRSKGFDQKKETGYRRIYSLQTEEVNVCQKTLFNWLQQQKALRKVVTCREFKEKAFSFYKSVGLNPPHIRHLHNFKQIYRNEIHDEQLIRDGRGRPPLEAEKLKKRRRMLKQAKEVKLSIQREADLDLLEEFDIPDCRVVVKLIEPCELSSKDRLYLQKRCHQMYRKLSSLNSFTKVKTPKRPKCMRKLESVSKICNCSICNIELPNKLSLDKHMQSEHKDVCAVSNNICSLCGKSFPRNVDLTCHKRWHLMMQKHWYYCKVCDKFFKKDKLKEHMQQHLKEDVKLVLNEHQQLEVVDPEEKVEVNSLNESQLENLSCDSYLNTLQDNLNDSILENFDALTDHLDAELLSSSSPLNIGSDDEIFHSTNTESKIESNDITVKSDSGALESSSVKSDSRNNDSDTIALKSDSISTNNEPVSMEVDIIDKTDTIDALSGAVSVVSDNNRTLVEFEIINASSNDIDAKCSLNENEPFAKLNGLNSADMEIDNNETLIVTSPIKFDISRHIESQDTCAASTSFAVEGSNKSEIPNEIKAVSTEANISAKIINSTACVALESSLKCKDTLFIEKKATDVMLIVDQCLKESGSVIQNSDAHIAESTNFVTISSEIVEGKLGANLEKIASTTDIEHNKNIDLPQSNCIDADQGSQMSFCEENVPANQPVEI